MTRLTFLPVMLASVAVAAGALIVEPARAGGGACHQAPDEREGIGTLVLLRANCFSPTVLRVEAGVEVAFRNNDQMAHHVAGVANTWGTEPGGNVKPGEVETYRFDEPGTYPYSCYIHLGMTGVVVVGDGAFAAMPKTNATGVQVVSHSSSSAPQGIDADGGPAPAPQAAAATTVDSSSGPNAVVVGALGALAGAAVVAVGFAARGVRRRGVRDGSAG